MMNTPWKNVSTVSSRSESRTNLDNFGVQLDDAITSLSMVDDLDDIQEALRMIDNFERKLLFLMKGKLK
jgi:hypothetical protein